MTTNFPISFYDFHKDEGLNFQLNRFYTSGILNYDEVNDIRSRITSQQEMLVVSSVKSMKRIKNTGKTKEINILKARKLRSKRYIHTKKLELVIIGNFLLIF